jgi:hypothetical protein
MLLMKKCVRTETCVDDAHPHTVQHGTDSSRSVSYLAQQRQEASSLILGDQCRSRAERVGEGRLKEPG